MKMFLNGRLVDASEAKVSVFDHGFMYGLGLFETFRTYEGAPFLLTRHLDRLSEGCRILELEWERDDRQIRLDLDTLLKSNGWRDAYIRYTVSAGIDQLGLPTEAYRVPTVLIYAKPLPDLPESLYTKGKALQKLATKRNSPETSVRLKSLHYMNNIIAKQELRRYPWAGSAEGLLLTNEGYLAEGIVSNLFFVKSGKVFTPDVKTGILPGITRAAVLELCDQAGLERETGFYTWEELKQADEIFLTNSIQEVVPVTCLYEEDGKSYKISAGQVGTYTACLMKAYQKLVKG